MTMLIESNPPNLSGNLSGNYDIVIYFNWGCWLRVIISLVLNSLWGMRKKMKFPVKEQGKFEEYPGLYFYLIYPKNEQKKVHKFFQKNLYILRTLFFTPHTIFIAFLCIKVFQLDIFLKIIYVIFETLFSFYLFCVK